MLPGLTDEQSFRRLKEMEEDVIRLTNAEDPNEAMDRHAIVEPRARLQKLTAHIQKLTERYVAGTPKAKLQLLVLEMLEVRKGEFIDEIEQIEAVRRQRGTAHSPRLETDDGQNRGDTPPLADPIINETDERTETPFTGPLETNQPGDSEPVVTEERVKTLIEEFSNRKAEARITEIEADYRDDTILHNEHLKPTEDLEDKISKMVDDMDRFQEKTKQQLTKVDEDLGRSSADVSSTLDRFIDLEKKNASLEERNDKLEADLKAVTEQVTELINAKINADNAVEEANARAAKDIQDALDEESRKAKEAPRLSEEEIAVREQNIAAKNPAIAKSMAAQAAKDAERLNTEKQRLEGFAEAHKKTKATSSSSVPATWKRKTPSRKVQVTGMLERITETNIETPPHPASQTEDENEENLEPRSTRQRVSNAVPIGTVGQPQDGGSSSRTAPSDEEQPTDDMMEGFLPSESE
ncbi:dentin matrix acidic phosphoprotein 1-like [Impatiens glandulifera]|uniref:dentin matrix acidic phosphoprotein 1-like n=1 Tax=Impatiens glandulifera TaxID=253017 RepID=UPI001FB19AC3|nr:dentin matrix acidic phosphoprotein 1-like [Impatiens glandulifera]